MAIQVRQLVVKTTTEQKTTADPRMERKVKTGSGESSLLNYDIEQIKLEILAQCRQLIIETIRDEKER